MESVRAGPDRASSFADVSACWLAYVQQRSAVQLDTQDVVREALYDLVWAVYHAYPSYRDALIDDLGSLGLALYQSMIQAADPSRAAVARSL